MKNQVALRISIALAFGLGSLTTLSRADTASDSNPPEGTRSLFDYLVTKPGPDGALVYDVPFPFEKLVRHLAARARGSVPGDPELPSMLLIPNGRSLQKDNADAASPRAVVAFTAHPSKSNDVSLSLRDRLFVAYAAKANQLEILSYNEAASRFEFQIVSDYTEGRTPKVVYANREFCVSCHRAQLPIFPSPGWDETNKNPGVYAALMSASDNSETFFNIVHTRGNQGVSDAVDKSTDRGGRMVATSRFWRLGCRNPSAVQGLPPNFSPEECRAHVLLYALASVVGLDVQDLSASEGGYNFVSYDKIAEVWRKNLSDADLRFYLGDILNRNPSGYQDIQILQMPDEADRIALWKKNLATDREIDADHDPANTPLKAYAYDPDIDTAKQALDLTIAQISGLITPSERAALPKTAAAFHTQFQGHFAEYLAATKGPFGEQPLRKGALLAPLFKAMGVSTLGGQPVMSACCENTATMPPVQVDDGLITSGGGLAVLDKTCGTASCHGGVGITSDNNVGFLTRAQGTSARDVWLKIVKSESTKLCQRLDWNQPLAALPLVQRMPKAPQRKAIELAEAANAVSARKLAIEGYRAKVLEFAADADARSQLGLDGPALEAIANGCNWVKYNGH